MSKREFHTSKQAYQRQLEALDRMREYCEEGVRCRRNLLVEHFGEQPQQERLCCEEGNLPCDNCERLRCEGNVPCDKYDSGDRQRHDCSPTPVTNRYAVCNKHPKNRSMH